MHITPKDCFTAKGQERPSESSCVPPAPPTDPKVQALAGHTFSSQESLMCAGNASEPGNTTWSLSWGVFVLLVTKASSC